MANDEHYIPVAVEYIAYPPLMHTVTFIRTDILQSEARRKGQTLCELAIEHCRDEGLDVTGRAHIYELGVFAPAGGTRIWKVL